MRVRVLVSLAILGGHLDSAWSYSSAKTALNVEYSSYVRSNQNYFGGDEKADSLSTVGMGLNYDYRKGRRHSKIDLDAFHSFAEDHSYINARDLYADYTRGDINYTFGRRRITFSSADEFWQTGIWQPRFMWDKMRPEQTGLTGFFVKTAENNNTRVNFFLSPLYAPEEGQRYEEKNGKVTSRNPWFRPPPPKAEIFDQVTDVRAVVDEPEAEDVVSAFSMAVRADHEVAENVTIGGAYGVMPVNQSILGYKYKLITANGEQYARINIEPTFPYHHVLTTDVSTKADRWSTVTSATYESPFKVDRTPTKITQQIRDMVVASFTVGFNLIGEGATATQLYGGLIKAWGAVQPDGGEDTAGTTQFEVRQRWIEAARLGIRHPVWSKYRRLNNSFEVTYDRAQNGATLSTQAEYNFYDAWVATASIDMLGVFDSRTTIENETTFIRQYRANDRVSMGLSYAY
jgi:hypothetical protein